MTPNYDFLRQPPAFWASVRSISEKIGYSKRGQDEIKTPTFEEIVAAVEKLGLAPSFLISGNGPSPLADSIMRYYAYRADMLNNYVKPRLMDGDRAKDTFNYLKKKLKPTWPVPMNKQAGKKKKPAYLSAIVNMIVEHASGGHSCDYNPLRLTTVTREGQPVRTLARRVDGAFPSTVNPIAVWEIKEYYYTTTFGSRVADGIYETLLDGMELAELRENEGVEVLHYLIIDAFYTWWRLGKSYLCRLVDILHMGYVDEVLFGYETVERLPGIAAEWVRRAEGAND